MALPRSFRFPDRAMVQRIIARGRRVPTPLGHACMAIAPDHQSRILFVIPKRSAAKSTERHRIKRVLDGWVLRNRSRIGGCALVMLVSPEAGRSGHALLQRARAAFTQIGVLTPAERA